MSKAEERFRLFRALEADIVALYFDDIGMMRIELARHRLNACLDYSVARYYEIAHVDVIPSWTEVRSLREDHQREKRAENRERRDYGWVGKSEKLMADDLRRGLEGRDTAPAEQTAPLKPDQRAQHQKHHNLVRDLSSIDTYAEPRYVLRHLVEAVLFLLERAR